jgi:hypothetical protein
MLDGQECRDIYEPKCLQRFKVALTLTIRRQHIVSVAAHRQQAHFKSITLQRFSVGATHLNASCYAFGRSLKAHQELTGQQCDDSATDKNSMDFIAAA